MRTRPEHVVMGITIALGLIFAAIVWLAKAAGWV
jgi:hypothetical protein